MPKKSRLRLLSLFFALLLCACPNLNDDPEQKQGQKEEETGDQKDKDGQEQGEEETGGQKDKDGQEQKEEKPQDPVDDLIDTDVGRVERFWTLNLKTGNQYVQISATLLAETESCLVYAECDAAGRPKNNLTRDSAEGIARKYAATIYPQISGAFGEIVHITGKGKITLLLLDIQDGLDPETEGFVAGYFSIDDMEAVNYFSNKRDMLYIDTNPGLLDMEGLYSTMAHELQHLINYSNRVLQGKSELDLWINEGLSTAAEYIYGGDPSYRVASYNADIGGTIQFGNNFFVWYGYWELASPYYDGLANYSTVYLFFQWLRIHAANGTGIYKEILNSPYGDVQAVIENARKRIPELNLTGSKAGNWEILLRTWLLANAYQNPSGLYGYRDSIGEMTRGEPAKLATTYFIDTKGQGIEFYPGEGIFSQMDASPYTPAAESGPHVRYVGFSKTGAVDTTPPYEGEYLLTFNANADNTARYPSGNYLIPGETGYLASTLAAASGREFFGGQRSLQAPAKGPAKPYPVDARFLIEKRKWENSGRLPAAGVDFPAEQ
ncbi:MAG: hypothetical protein LBP42_02905 [Treponema sp.]|jgi:hypothetical protein|nr:hypothetical protein [Treponema sp.]